MGSSMAGMVRLPNGRHIDAARVVDIRPVAGLGDGSVLIDLEDGTLAEIPVEGAGLSNSWPIQTAADRIAFEVNRARGRGADLLFWLARGIVGSTDVRAEVIALIHDHRSPEDIADLYGQLSDIAFKAIKGVEK